MFMTKLKFAAAIVVTVVTLGLGTGYVTHQVIAGDGAALSTARQDKREINQKNDGQQKSKNDGDNQKQAEVTTGRERPQRDGRENDGKTFRGYVTEIDAAKKTITFQSGGRGEAPTTKTFDVAKDVKVTLRTGRKAQGGKLEDVPVKTSILVKLDDAKKIVQAIEVTISTTASGAVSEIDEKSITLISGREETKSATYALAKDTKIQYWRPGARDGRGTPGQARSLKLAEVVAKMHVTVQLDDDLKVVQSINVELPQMGGAIGAIDAKKGTLSLKVGRGDDLNLTVSKDARILIEGKAGSIDKVAAGAEVILILTPDRTQVLWLQTPLPERRRE